MCEDSFEKLQNIVGLQLGIEPEKIKPEADFAKELGADSLDVVELVMAIEEAFDIEMDIDDIIDFSSFEKGMEILSKYNVIING